MLDLFLITVTLGILMPLSVIAWGFALWCLVEIFRD